MDKDAVLLDDPAQAPEQCEKSEEHSELAAEYPDMAKQAPPGYSLYRDHEKEEASCCCPCCKRCCHPTAFLRPDSTESRVILPFYPRRCTRVGPGMNERDLIKVPAGLAALGLRQELWSEFMDRLDKEVQPQTSSACCMITACLTSLGLACLCYNPRRYQSAVEEWQNDLNERLAEVGMFCKTQTHIFGYMVYNQYGAQRHEIRSSWLAIAIGPEAIRELERSDHLTESGVPSGCRKGGCCQPCCDAETGYVV